MIKTATENSLQEKQTKKTNSQATYSLVHQQIQNTFKILTCTVVKITILIVISHNPTCSRGFSDQDCSQDRESLRSQPDRQSELDRQPGRIPSSMGFRVQFTSQFQETTPNVTRFFQNFTPSFRSKSKVPNYTGNPNH